MRYAGRAVDQLKKTEGVKHHSLKMQNPVTYWTLTAWESRELMLKYRNSGDHLEAMKMTKQMTNNAQAAGWEGDAVPSWKDAMKELEQRTQGKNMAV
jgi:heme-degrading monooxygenase HmoA